MTSLSTDIDVLIVGAGPVGLFLANECARRGLRWRLVEQKSRQSEHSKALAIFPRTLEVFDMAGVAAPFVAAAHPVTSVAAYAHGERIAHLPFTPDDTLYSYIAMVPQDVTERLLVERLAARGGQVAYDTCLSDLTQQQDRVTATLQHAGASHAVTARYLVGCDGAHSTVRHALDLPFEGGDYHDQYLLADLDMNDALPADQMQVCPHAAGPLAIFPISAIRRRIVARVDEVEGDTPSLAQVRRLLAERAPAGVIAQRLHWSSYFRIHHRQVTRLRHGRVFLAGDAAHIHSPFGGQGMNTGLQDAWNLAWKLDLAIKGLGNDALLDSYDAERIPVIRQVVASTDLMTRAMAMPNRFAQALRDLFIPVATRLAPLRHALVQRLSELSIDYHGSPLVDGAGERYMDATLRDGGILSRFLLLVGDDAGDATRAAARRLADDLADVVELRHAPGTGLRLVRPDGHLAYVADRPRDGAAADDARGVLARQTVAGS